MIYLYDGNFDGFLSCVFEHYYNKKAEAIYSQNSYEPRLFEETLFIETDSEKAERVQQALIKKISTEAYINIYYGFHSKNMQKDTYLLKYVELAFKIGGKIDLLFTNEIVAPVIEMKRKVSRERHLFLGILRFLDAGNCLVAEIEPENDILPLIAGHFADRLLKERFLIYDKVRKKAVICKEGEWYIRDIDLKDRIVSSEKEEYFQELWREYFKRIGIENRRNLKLQQSFVPLKYRNNITEFKQ